MALSKKKNQERKGRLQNSPEGEKRKTDMEGEASKGKTEKVLEQINKRRKIQGARKLVERNRKR